jgi:prepilin-type N-terminal cleavage/methylation domain-containing protein
MHMNPPRSGAAGFTLVELVVVMTLMAVITAVGMSRFADRDPFAVQAVADQLVSALRLAQATATAQRASVFVAITASPPALGVCLDAGCTKPLSPPGDSSGSNWISNASGVHLSSGASFSFGPDGTPVSLAATLQLQVQSDSGTATPAVVTLEAGSGYVHAP